MSLWLVNKLKRPVILFDPRGTGNASRLNCSLQQKPLSLHLDVDLFDIRRCLSEIGNEIFHYSATSIVNDLELLRLALGFDKWDLFGFSYGGLISQVYGVLFPNSIHSMLLDSPVPMRYKDLYQARSHKAYARIYAEKNKWNSSFSMKTFRNQLKSVLWRLRWNRALREDVRINPRLLYHLYRFTPDAFPEAIAAAADDRNYTGLQKLADEFDPRLVPLRNWSIAMAVSTTCNTIVDFVPWESNAGLFERIARLFYDVLHMVGLNGYSPFYLTEAFESTAKLCIAMPPTHLRRDGLPLEKQLQGEFPALVLVGDLDFATPMEGVVDLDLVLRKNVALVKGANHFVARHPCGEKLFMEFLTRDSVKNLSVCG